jgi:hypothetical protein
VASHSPVMRWGSGKSAVGVGAGEVSHPDRRQETRVCDDHSMKLTAWLHRLVRAENADLPRGDVRGKSIASTPPTITSPASFVLYGLSTDY